MRAGRTGLAGLLLLAILASALMPSAAAAQQMPMFKYYVWGRVRVPGAYGLGPNPDVLELISAAGGPADGANLRRVELVRTAGKERVRLNFDRMIREGDIIPLLPGDVVIVPQTGWHSFRTNFWVVGGAVSLVNLGLLIYSISR